MFVLSPVFADRTVCVVSLCVEEAELLLFPVVWDPEAVPDVLLP